MNAASSAVAKAAFVLLIWLFSQVAAAANLVTVSELTGTVSAQGSDGSVRVLGAGSKLNVGDIVQTEKDSAANLRFPDGALVALRANTRFLIETYQYNLLRPEDDNAVVRLIRGGFRTVTGVIGKRGDPEAYKVRTLTSVIGIRGTDYALLQCQDADPDCAALKVPRQMRTQDGKPPAGLYLSVFEGKINAANRAGDRDFPAGKNGYIRDEDTLPVEIDEDLGLSREFMGFHGIFDMVSPLDASPEACVVK